MATLNVTEWAVLEVGNVRELLVEAYSTVGGTWRFHGNPGIIKGGGVWNMGGEEMLHCSWTSLSISEGMSEARMDFLILLEINAIFQCPTRSSLAPGLIH